MATKKAATKTADESIITMDRRRGDRRSETAQAADRPENPRRKKQRRRHIDPTTCERDYNEQEIEFMRAMDDYKHASGRMFPTCSEVLEVIRNLGYVQLAEDQIEELGLGMGMEDEGTLEDCEEELSEV